VSGNPVVNYEFFEFVVTGCASPVVTVDTCSTVSGLNTVLYLYQKSGGGTGGIFDPSQPCNNAVNSNNNNATFCGASSTLSALTSTLTPGNFVVVVATNGAGETGGYTLKVDTATAGCTVSQFTGCTYSLNPLYGSGDGWSRLCLDCGEQ
jgi:hypothetical protein